MRVLLVLLVGFITIASLSTLSASKNYDYIVVGGGTAGSVVAAELSRDPEVSVLLLERGDDVSHLFEKTVYFWGSASYGAGANITQLASENYWVEKYFSQEADLRSLVTYAPSLAGGGAMVNGNAFSRLSAADLEAWNSSRWNYTATLADWKSLENCFGIPSTCNAQYHGADGPISTLTVAPNSVLQKVLDAMPSVYGVPLNPDINGPVATGAGVMPRNIKVIDGVPYRQDTWSKLIRPALARGNLEVKLGALVRKINFQTNDKNIVVYDHEYNTYNDKADREVILSAGDFGSPKILQLSGVGDCPELEAKGIDCVHHNPHVGKNLQDAAQTSMLFGTFTPPVTQNPGSIIVSYYRSPSFTGEGTDMEIAVSTVTANSPVFPTAPQAYLVLIPHTRPTSSGTVKVSSKNPNMWPQITYNMYPTSASIAPLVNGVRRARQLMAAANQSFFELRPGYVALPLNATDAQIETFLRGTYNVVWHSVGTCSMHKVVDEDLRLIDGAGNVIPGVSIIDLSVVPVHISTHGTSSTAMFVGTVGARIVKERWSK